MKEKKRPTLEELEEQPKEVWQLEMAHISRDAHGAAQFEIETEAASLVFHSDLTPAKVVELREKLQRATGSTVYTEFRADNWPLCPRCGEDELYSKIMLRWDGEGERPSVQRCIDGEMACYRCNWQSTAADAA